MPCDALVYISSIHPFIYPSTQLVSQLVGMRVLDGEIDGGMDWFSRGGVYYSGW